MIQRDNTAGLISMTNKGKKFIEQVQTIATPNRKRRSLTELRE